MTIRRLPSAITSATCCTRSLPSRDTAEYRSDRHPKSREVPFTENIAGHNLARRENVCVSAETLNFRPLIHLHAQICESDSRPKWISRERRPVDHLRPVRFRRIKTFGPAVIQNLMIKAARLHGLVEFPNGVFKFLFGQAESCRQSCDGRRSNWRKHRRHEAAYNFRIDDRVCNLVGLLCDQTPPDGIALGPKIFALIVEALAVFVDDNAQRHAIEPRDNTSIKFGRAAVDRDCMTLGRIADGFGAMIQKQLQPPTFVIGRPANDEVARRFAPDFLEPFQICFETAGSNDERLRAEFSG